MRRCLQRAARRGSRTDAPGGPSALMTSLGPLLDRRAYAPTGQAQLDSSSGSEEVDGAGALPCGWARRWVSRRARTLTWV